jgi:hypothetical protein
MRYEEKETIVHSGQAALLYSDGLVEAHDPEGDMFGFPRLRTLKAERAEEKRPLGEVLLEELNSFTGSQGRLGAGGRHHPPYAKAFRINKLNFSVHTATHFDQ